MCTAVSPGAVTFSFEGPCKVRKFLWEKLPGHLIAT